MALHPPELAPPKQQVVERMVEDRVGVALVLASGRLTPGAGANPGQLAGLDGTASLS
jgi:hypothetical protein